MLIDTFLPEAHFSETHSCLVHAGEEQVIAEAARFRPEDDPWFRRFLAVREFPATLTGRQPVRFSFDCFSLLADSRACHDSSNSSDCPHGNRKDRARKDSPGKDSPGKDSPGKDSPGKNSAGKDRTSSGETSALVYGLAGRFWQADYGLTPPGSADDFRRSGEQGLPRLVLAFSTHSNERPGHTLLRTETRLFCPDASDRRRMAVYWLLIRPVSGLIRRRSLALIRRRCEKAPLATPGQGA